MFNKYKIRQMVRLLPAPISDGRGIYEVVRFMSADETGEVSYRIRSGMMKRSVLDGEVRA